MLCFHTIENISVRFLTIQLEFPTSTGKGINNITGAFPHSFPDILWISWTETNGKLPAIPLRRDGVSSRLIRDDINDSCDLD